MNTETLARATFVLDRATVEGLAYLSQRFGVSRSELVRQVLARPVSDMAAIARAVPEDPSPSDLRRVAREGLHLIEDMAGPHLAHLRELARDE